MDMRRLRESHPQSILQAIVPMIRRSVRHLASVIAFVSLAVSLVSAAEDWPQFLGPTRDGQSPSVTLDAVPKEGWPLRWKAPVGEGFSGPVVVGDRVYLFHRTGDREILDCFSVSDGKPRWTHSMPATYSAQFGGGDGPSATPAADAWRGFALGASDYLQKPVSKERLVAAIDAGLGR